MNNGKILIVDDDTNICELLRLYIEKEGYSTAIANDGEQAIELFNREQPSLVLLDIMLPKLDGWQVCREIRKTSDCPIIMITAKGEVFDKILGLELGADDYITKPCNPRELLARINAVIKRSRITASGVATSEHTPLPESRLHLDQNQRICQIDGIELQVTGTEFDLLLALLKQKGEVVSKAWLSQNVLQRELQPFDRSLDVHVSRLRKKLQPFHDESIKAIRGKGYQLVL